MFGMGIGELSVILLIVLVVFGARKLPELGDGLGKGIANFRQSLKQLDSTNASSLSATTSDDDTQRR